MKDKKKILVLCVLPKCQWYSRGQPKPAKKMRTFFRLQEPPESMPLAKGTRSHTISSKLIEYFSRYLGITYFEAQIFGAE